MWNGGREVQHEGKTKERTERVLIDPIYSKSPSNRGGLQAFEGPSMTWNNGVFEESVLLASADGGPAIRVSLAGEMGCGERRTGRVQGRREWVTKRWRRGVRRWMMDEKKL